MALSLFNRNKLNDHYNECKKLQYSMIGYPSAADFDYTDVNVFLQFALNNAGDWSQDSNYGLNTLGFEKEVIEYFAGKFQINFEDSWGYITNGGTEGNMYGCYLAREIFPDGVLYFSEDTHYSIYKIARMLKLRCERVASQTNGEIDYEELTSKLLSNAGSKAIIFANIGTTMRGAIDNIDTIKQVLSLSGYKREEYYIHADAALHGMVLPFVDKPQPFTFKDGIDSISTSGNKVIGMPIPCGIVLTRKSYSDLISSDIEYIDAKDKTLTGSRNALTPLMLWKAINTTTEDEKYIRVNKCLDLSKKMVLLMNKRGIKAWANENSPVVVFPRPSETIWKKYGVAVCDDIAHIVINGHLLENQDLLYQLIDSLAHEALTV